MQKRLHVACLIILLAGFSAAGLIYATVEDDPDAAILRDWAESKRYNRELQRFGGKTAVLFDDFNRWFAGLWQGKKLAATVAWITVFTAGGVFLVARRLDPDSKD